MNKFAVIALLALASQMVVAEESETSLLLGNEKLFSDYCLESFDYLKNEATAAARSASAGVYEMFFKSANEIADEVMNVEKDAVAQLSKQIGNPDSPIDEAPISENEVAALIDQGKREIQARGIIRGFFPGVKSATSAMMSAANSALFVRLAKARSYLSLSVFTKYIYSTCDKIAEYEQILESRLEEAKQKVSEQNSGNPEIEEFLNGVSIKTLHCPSTKNVQRLHAFCELFKNGKGPFMKMLGKPVKDEFMV